MRQSHAYASVLSLVCIQSIVAAKPKPGIQTLFKRLVAMRGGSK